MGRWMAGLLALVGCAGAGGDWTVVSAQVDGVEASSLTGILEIDRSDGETLLQLGLRAGEVSRRVDMTGSAVLDGPVAELDLSGMRSATLDDGSGGAVGGASPAQVTGACTEEDGRLACELQVDGGAADDPQAWSVVWRRD